VETVTVLLELGADTLAQDADGRTPLVTAVNMDNAKIVGVLVKMVGDALAHQAQSASGSTLLHMLGICINGWAR